MYLGLWQLLLVIHTFIMENHQGFFSTGHTWRSGSIDDQGGLGGEASGENFGGLKAILSMLIQIKQSLFQTKMESLRHHK